MLADSEHLDDVGMAHSGQLFPLRVKLGLLYFSLEVLDGDLPGSELRVTPHCSEHCPEGSLPQEDPSLNLIESDFFQTDGVLLCDTMTIVRVIRL